MLVLCGVVCGFGLVGSIVRGAEAATPSSSLVGTWEEDAAGQYAVWTISIGEQEKVDPDCSANVYCVTTPNTSSMGGTFYGEGVSLTPNGAGTWTFTCSSCRATEKIAVTFKGDEFKGTATDIGIDGQPVGSTPITGYRSSAPTARASLAVALSLAKARAAVGGEVVATVKLTAGGEDLTGVSLGLRSSSDVVAVSRAPSALSGLALAAGASRSFVFTVKGAKPGTAWLRASASGTAPSGAVRGGARTQLMVVQGVLTVVDVTRGTAALSADVRVKLEDPSTDASGCDTSASYDFTDPQLASAKKVGACIYELTFDAPGTGIYHVGLKATELSGVVIPVSVDQYGATVDGRFDLIIDSCADPADDLADVDALLDSDDGLCAVAVGDWDRDAADVASTVLKTVENSSSFDVDPVPVDSVDPSDWPQSRGLVLQSKAASKGLVLKSTGTGWVPTGTKWPPEITDAAGTLTDDRGSPILPGGAAALVRKVSLPPLPAEWSGASDDCADVNLDDQAPGTVISSHGLWYPPNGLMRVPVGDQISTYVPIGTLMSGCLGIRIDTGHGYGADTRYLHVYTAGQLIPNFTFVYYIGKQGKHVVNPDDPITLNNLIRPDEGRISLATCATLYIPAGVTLAQALSSVPVHMTGTGEATGYMRVTITAKGELQSSPASANP